MLPILPVNEAQSGHQGGRNCRKEYEAGERMEERKRERNRERRGKDRKRKREKREGEKAGESVHNAIFQRDQMKRGEVCAFPPGLRPLAD